MRAMTAATTAMSCGMTEISRWFDPPARMSGLRCKPYGYGLHCKPVKPHVFEAPRMPTPKPTPKPTPAPTPIAEAAPLVDEARAATPRAPLNRDRVLQAALALADDGGVEALSMRRLGQALGVEAMSLYKHVEDKEAILDGIADLVTEEMEVPSPDLPWREAIRRSAISAHEALRRHPWAGSVLESRLNPGPARLRYLDAMVGTLLGAGFDMPVVARAFMAHRQPHLRLHAPGACPAVRCRVGPRRRG